MANGLTGDYDAVAEVRVEAVNRILATLHQNGASKEASPTFPHSLVIRLGDVRRIVKLAQWSPGPLQFTTGGGGQGASPRTSSKKGMPPGVSESSQHGMAEHAAELEELLKPGKVRGTARLQLSTPTITIAPGAISEATAHVQIRAHYTPDSDTVPLPPFVHGEVRVAVAATSSPWQIIGSRLITVQPSADDNKIVFLPAPGSGLSAAAANTVAEQIRIAVRTNFEPTNIELPADFPVWQFKGLGSGASAAIVFPVNLAGGRPAPPPSAIAGVTNLFLKSYDHFAVALSKQYIESTIQRLKELIDAYQDTITVEVLLPFGPFLIPVDFDYHVSVASPTLTWQHGSIKLTVHGSATATDPAPDYDFTIEQLLTLAFNPATQKIALQAAGDPSISGLPEPAVDQSLAAIIQQRNAALAEANQAIGQLTTVVKLDDALDPFNASATSTLTAVDIEPDGVVLRGRIAVKARTPAYVHFTKTADGTKFSALKTWIPGGTIDRYEWQFEKENPHFDEAHHHLEGTKLTEIVPMESSFIVPIPDTLPPHGGVCLTIRGTQIGSQSGVFQQILAGYCRPQLGVQRVIVPPAWVAATVVPIWETAPADASLDSAIAAHVSAFTRSDGSVSGGSNTLVHFVDAQSARPLETLGRALSQRTRRDGSIAVILVLPRGSFGDRRSAVNERLGSFARDRSIMVFTTEDYESGWTRMFKADCTPSTYLLDARGAAVWQQEGSLDARAIAAALDEHATPGTRPGSELLRLAIQPGERAPDGLFNRDDGEQVALRTLRGQRVLLNFWKSWSTPCLAELARLQQLHERAGRTIAIIAINDGEAPERVAEIRRKLTLTIPLAHDTDREIGRRYDVKCWPTTVSIGVEGRVERIQFGTASEPERGVAGAGVPASGR